ncbi:MAG: hypothetical protein KBB37_04880 [Bacteroidia bacterium]|nr:hypothetical protein [Bacteroidia bacterium]MBP7260602.1 hypothetical protein [Bacteroidia bacterium]MBP9179862.1 hypothetical protein [Bacteroidia bacterium]MBP9724224.1 hypothetical protein [Bacteroidia bacterium]
MTTFNELQKFKNTWFWFILAGGSIYLIVNILIYKKSITFLPPSIHFIMLFSTMGSAIVFWVMRLKTKIDSTGIEVQLSAFARSKHEWKWGEIKRAYVRQYKPLLEYGGWGIRYSFKNGRAFNVKGKIGLQLELNDGKKILIGTQQKDELNTVLAYLRNQYRIECIEVTA